MKTVTFEQPFHSGEISAQTMDWVIEDDPELLLAYWAHENTWGKCEFIKHEDETYRLRIGINTVGLPAGDYSDTYTVAAENHKAIFLVKFSVADPPVDPAQPLLTTDFSGPPCLVTVPKRVILGPIELGEQRTVEVMVHNTGGPLWETLTYEWGDDTWLMSKPVGDAVSNGQVFPHKITFVVDTSNASDYRVFRDTLVIHGGNKDIEVPVSFKVTKRVPPQLKFSHKKVFCAVKAGITRRIEIDITKTGSKLSALSFVWEHSQYTWHGAPNVSSEDIDVFPKRLSFILNSVQLVPGDYFDSINVVTDCAKYVIPIIIRVLPPDPET